MFSHCKFWSFVFVFMFALSPAAFAATSWQQDTANLLFEATLAGTPLPSLSAEPKLRTAENAYRVQALFFDKLMAHNKDSVAGFKAGLTAEPQMKRFGATTPAAAPLFKSGLIEAKAPSKPVQVKLFKGMMLETELAFKTARAITKPVKDEESLKKLMVSVHPAVEVPLLFFADMGKVDFFEIVASGIGSKVFIIGNPHPITTVDPDAVKIVLTHDGKQVNEGKGTDALDGQWKALLWLVNTMLEQGHKIKAGQYLMTGALGKMIPAQPGKYEADFAFDTLVFDVEK